MTISIAIAEKITTLRQVEEKLGLRLSGDSQFFTEWMADLPALSEAEQTRLEQVRQNYLYQISDGSLLEETVKMVVLSPLLELAGFYQAPYRFKTEVSVDIVAQGDNDEILRGRIDVLVLQGKLWIVLIESKKTTFDLELAIPQTLAYMAIHPNPEQPLYGMIANGSSYLFVKTLGKQYGISDLFATRSQYLNNLSGVLRIIMHLGRIITES
ncbi:PD-(D/E)XK nuclease family protein [Nostoc sp. CHAB 5784]|uniref:type I restriction enzyme HsdR N-terminal domain-containing protein n=1 Tax=Nostoc mirabile TaxID=2907820 RepID=UPI001E421DFE|nr:type I restriction enzyme HsdR N-terminal domain-containing protein [Nostoc mirabile]MCC5667924.1 PD-(D/E)XK nuclease family protein [Nostoc mirabile CHAB5784]